MLSLFLRLCSVQSLSRVRLSVAPWTVALQTSLSFTISQSLLKLMCTELVRPSNRLIVCFPLLFPPSVFPSIRVFSNELALCIRWPKYWSFSFSISPFNEYSGLISFRMDWFDLLVVQGALKSLLQHHRSSQLWCWWWTGTLESLWEQGTREGHSGFLGTNPIRLPLDSTTLKKHCEDGHFWKVEKHVLFFVTVLILIGQIMLSKKKKGKIMLSKKKKRQTVCQHIHHLKKFSENKDTWKSSENSWIQLKSSSHSYIILRANC